MKKINIKKFLPIVIGILLSIPLAIGAFFLTQGAMTRASSPKPSNVQIAQITDTSAVITWTTTQDVQGVVEYGTTTTQLNRYAPEVLPKTLHRVELTLLTPKTPYYFKIRIGTELYDNDGLAWTFTTKPENAEIIQKGVDDTQNVADLTPAPTLKVVDEKILRLPTNSAPIQLGNATIAPTQPVSTCPKTSDCEAIQARLGKGCSSSEYVACLHKNAPDNNVKGASTKRKKSSQPKTTVTPKPTLAIPATAGQ